MKQKCQAHNLKVVGSNPTPATNYINKITDLDHPQRLRFLGFFVVNYSVYTNHHANRSSVFSNLIITILILIILLYALYNQLFFFNSFLLLNEYKLE